MSISSFYYLFTSSSHYFFSNDFIKMLAGCYYYRLTNCLSPFYHSNPDTIGWLPRTCHHQILSFKVWKKTRDAPIQLFLSQYWYLNSGYMLKSNDRVPITSFFPSKWKSVYLPGIVFIVFRITLCQGLLKCQKPSWWTAAAQWIAIVKPGISIMILW